MTIEEFSAACLAQAGDNPKLNRLGFPVDKTTNGPLVRQMMDYCRRFPMNRSPWLGLSMEQCDQLSAELDTRELIFTGDMIYGGAIAFFWWETGLDGLEDPGDAVDFRDPDSLLASLS